MSAVSHAIADRHLRTAYIVKLDTLLAVMSPLENVVRIDQSRTTCGRFLSYSSADDWKAGMFVFVHAHVFVHACICAFAIHA